ncbi:MAG: permease [Alistipes senegalensis]|nr:permease [Oxalobacter formigenes]MCM1280980.1 permease [Alistipes senegalensis]
MESWWPMLKNALEMFLFLGIELSVLFILISAGVSLAQQYIPDTRIQALLGGAHGRGYILAALIGAITPFCSCSTIPMLRGLLKAKAGFGPTLTFLFTSPLLNPIILGLFIATFGLKVTSIYAGMALIVSIIAGIVLQGLHFERYVIPERDNSINAGGGNLCCGAKKHLEPLRPHADVVEEKKAPSCGCTITPKPAIQSDCCSVVQKPSPCGCGTPNEAVGSSSCCEEQKVVPELFSQKLKKAFRDGWKQFLQVLPYLLLGIALGAFIYGFVPEELITKYASGDNIFAVPIAAVIGIPLYVRVEALIPLTAVLVEKGMSLGAVMALIIGGGGASLTEVILLKSMFKIPMIIAFLAVIIAMAICAGYVFQFVV